MQSPSWRQMKFAENFKRLRKERGYSKNDIAILLGVSLVTLTFYETGRRFPNIDILCGIADIFHISLDELVSRKFDPDAGLAPYEYMETNSNGETYRKLKPSIIRESYISQASDWQELLKRVEMLEGKVLEGEYKFHTEREKSPPNE